MLSAPAYTDLTGLARLRAAAGDASSPARLREVAGQFEALFTHMMLKSMRSASVGGGLFESRQSEFYRDLFDHQIALELSRGKGLGIADLLMRQLGVDPDRGPATEAAAARAAMVPVSAHTAEQSPASGRDWRVESVSEFVSSLWPHAKATARRLGVSARALLAQAALETGWGQSTPRGRDGSSSFNLFGIKAGPDWHGPRVSVPTLEHRDGALRREHAHFRAYASIADSFADYASLLSGSPRYAAALARGADAKAFAQGLQAAGYATDPDYASKLFEVFQSDRLGEALRGLGVAGANLLER